MEVRLPFHPSLEVAQHCLPSCSNLCSGLTFTLPVRENFEVFMTKSCACSLCIFSRAAVMKHIASLLFVFSAPFERLAGKCHKIQVTCKKVDSPTLTCIYFFLFNCFFFIPTRLSPPDILCIYLSLLSIFVFLNSLHHPSA